jgi:hypothetical protein
MPCADPLPLYLTDAAAAASVPTDISQSVLHTLHGTPGAATLGTILLAMMNSRGQGLTRLSAQPHPIVQQPHSTDDY